MKLHYENYQKKHHFYLSKINEAVFAKIINYNAQNYSSDTNPYNVLQYGVMV